MIETFSNSSVIQNGCVLSWGPSIESKTECSFSQSTFLKSLLLPYPLNYPLLFLSLLNTPSKSLSPLQIHLGFHSTLQKMPTIFEQQPGRRSNRGGRSTCRSLSFGGVLRGARNLTAAGDKCRRNQGSREVLRRALAPPSRRPTLRWLNFRPTPSRLSNMSKAWLDVLLVLILIICYSFIQQIFCSFSFMCKSVDGWWFNEEIWFGYWFWCRISHFFVGQFIKLFQKSELLILPFVEWKLD